MNRLWNAYLDLIDKPFDYVVKQLDNTPSAWAPIVYRTIVTILAVFFLLNFLDWARRRILILITRDPFADTAPIDAFVTKNQEFVDTLEAARHLESTTRQLKQNKDYERLGEVYASVSQPIEAAKWFCKAKRYRRAAEEYARAGETRKAAKYLMKDGDYRQAAEFLMETKRFAEAARAYEKDGDLGNAAGAYMQAGNYAKALRTYAAYFESSQETVEDQLAAAHTAHSLLTDPPKKVRLKEAERNSLLAAVAKRFEQGKLYELAAGIYAELGDAARAGQTYVLAGKLDKAVECLRAAGKDAEANRIGGRHFASLGRWKEAGVAFAGSGEFLQAGECLAKAGDLVHAANCFEKAGENYRAAAAYAQAGKFETAIRAAQKVPETDKNYDVSRALLGRCFYELHDYAHCAAALDNHLTGKRVDNSTIDYFYMLALAYEQLGKLAESQDLLRKIRTVQVNFRDVKDRLSNIESRISMQLDGQGVPSPHSPRQRPPEATEIMAMIANNLGKRYELQRELGRGGMGVVYLARDRQLDRPVALKFLGSLLNDSDEYRKRFMREAKAAAKVNHPNIVSVYDISATEGKAYIAMEYVEGINLHRYVAQKGALAPREAVNVMRQVCSALAAIHAASIVHRDLKPDNILIAKGGLVKIGDFGLAKGAGIRLTGSNVVMGTPSYMSPEQAMGKPADARSDIYSLGLIFHEVLTGKTYFLDGEIMQRQIEETPPPPSRIKNGVPPELDGIVMKCLIKNPDLRYQSAREVLDALRAVPVE